MNKLYLLTSIFLLAHSPPLARFLQRGRPRQQTILLFRPCSLNIFAINQFLMSYSHQKIGSQPEVSTFPSRKYFRNDFHPNCFISDLNSLSGYSWWYWWSYRLNGHYSLPDSFWFRELFIFSIFTVAFYQSAFTTIHIIFFYFPPLLAIAK